MITVPTTWTNDARALILRAAGLAGLVPHANTPGDDGARLAIAVEPDWWGCLLPDPSVVSVVSQHATPRSVFLAELYATDMSLPVATAVDRRFMALLAHAAGQAAWPQAAWDDRMLRDFAAAKVSGLEVNARSAVLAVRDLAVSCHALCGAASLHHAAGRYNAR